MTWSSPWFDQLKRMDDELAETIFGLVGSPESLELMAEKKCHETAEKVKIAPFSSPEELEILLDERGV